MENEIDKENEENLDKENDNLGTNGSSNSIRKEYELTKDNNNNNNNDGNIHNNGSEKETIIGRMMNTDNDNMYNVKEKTNGSSSYRNKDIFDLKTLFTLRQDRLWNVLHERYKYNTSIKRGQMFLLNHVDSKLDLVVMYADLVGSTSMSMYLPVEKMAKIIKAYSHELSSVVESYDGFVLKYVGDAVIAFFPAGFNKYLICDRSYQCAKSMINVIENGINPIFEKDDYPKLAIKIGIDEGENVAIQYGYDKSAPIDLIGFPMNVTAKITSLTAPNKISVGNNVFKLLHPSIQTRFHEMLLKENEWKYVDHQTNLFYKVFTI
ncbi:MAG: adenylate/guanylate cyclase domain-containing protein [Candidatus Nitrosocosmicus sp.]